MADGKLASALVLAFALLALAQAPSAVAGTEGVSTPLGKVYVEERHELDPPSLDMERRCFGTTCLPIWPWVDFGRVDAGLALWEETNGCPDLQKEPTVCPTSGRSVSADERLVAVDP